MIKNKIVFNDATDWMFNLDKADGCHIWVNGGKKLLDFTSAWNVTNLGWNNPEISQAMQEQIRKNTCNVLWASDEVQIDYANKLCESLPGDLKIVARSTGGTESNEEAMKTARAFTGRKKIIGFTDTYHGQSFGVMALGYRPEFTKEISPLVPEIIQIEYPRSGSNGKSDDQILAEFSRKLESLLAQNDIAAIVTEAGIITGWGSTYTAPKGYLKLVRELTARFGTLMILDEVGTGFSRCGRLYGMELENVIPDIVTLAKGLSNGQGAIGAMVTTRAIAEATMGKTNLTSTFGWNPVACVAARKTLEIHQRDRIWEKAQTDGQYLIETLKSRLEPTGKLKAIRGLGLEIGLELASVELAKNLVTKAFNNGLHIILGDGANIQLMPPLVIPRKELDEGIDILVASLKA